jgi:hypothetical protein
LTLLGATTAPCQGEGELLQVVAVTHPGNSATLRTARHPATKATNGTHHPALLSLLGRLGELLDQAKANKISVVVEHQQSRGVELRQVSQPALTSLNQFTQSVQVR